MSLFLLKINNQDVNLSPQKFQIDISYKKKASIDDKNFKARKQLKSLQNINQKQLSLQELFDDDRQFIVTGVMHLASMNLTDSDMPMIIKKIFGEHKTKCIGLNFRHNSFTSVGVKMLAYALLAAQTQLKYLNFSNNMNIGDVAIEDLVLLFKKTGSIAFLALSNTGMTDRGVRLIADLLCNVSGDSCCPPLEKLYLSFNELITDESLEALLEILERNHTLKRFSVQYCRLSDEARQTLREASKKKNQEFDMSE